MILFNDNEDTPTIEINIVQRRFQIKGDYVLLKKYKEDFIDEFNELVNDKKSTTDWEIFALEFKNKLKDVFKEYFNKGYIKRKKKPQRFLEIQNKNPESHPVTRGRINKMLKYFKGKNIKAKYEYNNSIGDHKTRRWNGVIKGFNIMGQTEEDYYPYRIEIVFEKNKSLQQIIPRDAWFNGLGKISWTNGGPSCYFEISLKKE